ncbi:MAG: hypothetical protein ACJ8F7_16535 [Gemmataceae bacterium]
MAGLVVVFVHVPNKIATSYARDYQSAYADADAMYAMGFDVQIVYDLTDGGAMTV